MCRVKLLAIGLLVFVIKAYGAWELSPIWTTGYDIGIALGNGRNDGVARAYCVYISDSTIKEFTYSAGWTNTSDISLPFYVERPLVITNGRNDGVQRLYTGEFSGTGGGNTAEYTWNGTGWDYLSMGATGRQLISLVAGNGRNDGVNRLYYAIGSWGVGDPYIAISEYSYSAGWAVDSIASPAGYNVGSFGLALGPGRDDGTNRLYVGVHNSDWAVGEYTWTGSGWTSQVVDSGTSQIMGIVTGNGRNDGVNRVYVACRNEGVREYRYSAGSWVLDATITVPGETFDVDLGTVCDTNRLYIAQYGGNLYEATYYAGWSSETVGAPGGYLFRTRVGLGRDDGKIRVYTAGSVGFFEYESDCEPAGVNEQTGCPVRAGLWASLIKDGALLRFSLQDKSEVLLSLFDVRGALIEKKSLGVLDKGEHQFVLRMTHLTSGVYFVALETKEKRLTTKIIWLQISS